MEQQGASSRSALLVCALIGSVISICGVLLGWMVFSAVVGTLAAAAFVGWFVRQPWKL
ncbi:Tfp pilus assembly protein PilN [Curtobacterium flaccumfaciens]|nr:hypothetical protein [Curtobacterium flaccumfaciens]MDQ0540879.1 Tfp pilus assembly protein PilN [Curtobacterium flaccumfaciens]